jgi:segregation and condensation protein A
MESYKVQLEEWQGPLDLLLQLIEQQEMDITKISLSRVAEQFIAYMNTKPLQLEETADFLVVAAKLIYIKSKALLPTLSLEEEDGIDLEKQLKMYKEYLEAAKKIQSILNKKAFCFSKDKFPEGITGQVFYVPKSITTSKLKNVYTQLIDRIKPFVELPKKIIQKTVKLSERINFIREMIFREATASFGKILGDSKSKTDKIVNFLAVLELVKQKIIDVEQKELFEDITLNKI